LSSKSAFLHSTSKSYALALYELAKENSELNKVEIGIKGLDQLLKDSPDFKDMVLSPTVNKEEKKNVLYAIAEKNNFSKILKKFLGFLTIKNRLFYLNQIINSFLNFVSINKGELKVKLSSSKKLSEIELENIKKELSKDLKSLIQLEYKYDPDLIGGLVIQVGSVMVDTSIKNKLEQLKKGMIEA